MSHVAAAREYAQAVCSGAIPACKWVRLAAKRQLEDLERQHDEDWPYLFDEVAAERVCRFIELLPHIKGKWAGQRLKLEPWQSFILTTVFGWREYDTGFRRFRTAYVEVPRKNAKSTLSSGVALYMLAMDGEAGAECYSAATTRDQARIVFNDAKRMAERQPAFRRRYGVGVHAHNLSIEATASKLEPLSAEGSSLDGLNVHLAVIDELHAHKTRAVFDVIETAMGARTQPLLWLITTAGSNRAGICYEQRGYVAKLLDQVVADETYFGIVYTLDEGDDWTKEKSWRKANPNYGVSVFPEDIARLCRKAQEMASAQNNFLTKRLNVWVNADTAWMDMRAWEHCAEPELTLDDFAGEPCWVGIDLASRVDIAAVTMLFVRDGRYHVFGRWYLPEDTVEEAGNSQYAGWATEGRLITTPGNVTDFGYIEQDLEELASVVEIREVAYDPFQATQFSQRMMERGFPMVELRPTVLNFSEPMKQLEALVRERKLRHDGDPVLTWMVSNVVCHLDAKDNIYPRKERPENKIDGVVALIMSLNRALLHDTGPSTLDTEGLVVL